jgi:nucleotide-binding universal stress UspA family protein
MGCGAAVGDFAAEAERSVEEAAEAVRAQHPGLRIPVDETPVTPADALSRDRSRQDVVVVGASRHTDAAAFWLGSASRLLRRCPCPVVFVPSPGPHMHRARRVVVGVDGSAAARVAIMWAGEEAQRHGAALLLVHGWS